MNIDNMSATMRAAIRDIKEGTNGGFDMVDGRTYNALRKRKLVKHPDGGLTELGERAYKKIMESGDGPERLKAMFRF